MGLSPQLNRVVITQFVRFLYPVRLSMLRFRVNGEIVPLGAFNWSDKSPRSVKSRLTLTWTCSRNCILQFPNVIEKSVYWSGIGLQWKRSKYDPLFCMQERIHNLMENKKSLGKTAHYSLSAIMGFMPGRALSCLMVQAAEGDSHNDNGLDTTRRANRQIREYSSAIPRPFFCQQWSL